MQPMITGMLAFTKTLWSDLRALPRPVLVLVGGQFINRFGSFVMPFLALYLTDLGMSWGNVALVLGTMSLGGLAGPIASGYLADAIGRRNTIVLGLVTNALCIVTLAYCRTMPQFMIVALAQGFCSFLYNPAASALLTDLVPADQRVLAFALLRLALNAGFAAGPAVAGILFSRAPTLIFYGDAATTLIYALLAFVWLPHGLRTVTGRLSSARVIWQSWRDALRDMIHNRPFVILIVSSLLMEIAFVQSFNVLALTVTGQGLSPEQYGVIMGLNGALIMFIELPLNQWARRFDLRRVLVVGFALVGLGCASFGLMHTQTGFFIAMTIFTVGEMLALPISQSYTSTLAPEAFRGRYFGVRTMVWAIAAMSGGAGVWFYGQLGATWWYLAGGIGVIGALIMMSSLREPITRESAAVKAA